MTKYCFPSPNQNVSWGNVSLYPFLCIPLKIASSLQPLIRQLESMLKTLHAAECSGSKADARKALSVTLLYSLLHLWLHSYTAIYLTTGNMYLRWQSQPRSPDSGTHSLQMYFTMGKKDLISLHSPIFTKSHIITYRRTTQYVRSELLCLWLPSYITTLMIMKSVVR